MPRTAELASLHPDSRLGNMSIGAHIPFALHVPVDDLPAADPTLESSPVQRAVKNAHDLQYDLVCVPLTTEAWKTRWQDMCVVPTINGAAPMNGSRDLKLEERAEQWRAGTGFRRNEVTMSRPGRLARQAACSIEAKPLLQRNLNLRLRWLRTGLSSIRLMKDCASTRRLRLGKRSPTLRTLASLHSYSRLHDTAKTQQTMHVRSTRRSHQQDSQASSRYPFASRSSTQLPSNRTRRQHRLSLTSQSMGPRRFRPCMGRQEISEQPGKCGMSFGTHAHTAPGYH